MADPELVKTLDYILNRSDPGSIEVISEAVIRRRRDLSIFHATGGMPDPSRLAQSISEQITMGVGGGLDTMKQQIRQMMLRIIKEHAPELSDAQMDELCQAWLPETPANNQKSTVPRDVLVQMIEHFISFSRGTMNEAIDINLRKEMGAWPERYWKSFPPVIRNVITEFLKDKITEDEFYSKLGIALDL